MAYIPYTSQQAVKERILAHKAAQAAERADAVRADTSNTSVCPEPVEGQGHQASVLRPSASSGPRHERDNETGNLPALIADLPGDSTRAPQTQFGREPQTWFLSHLATTGSARGHAADKPFSYTPCFL